MGILLYLLATLAIVLLALSWGRQALWSLRLAMHYPPSTLPADLPSDSWPLVTVCVPLRGADPVLRDTLRGLCLQEYPHYEIRIIIDSEADSAWPIVREILAEFPQVKICTSILKERLETCSLKVSALLQVFKELDWQTGVVALIDADCVPPPHWLRELVRPFHAPRVAATSGVRWFHTDCRAWGSLVRGLWGMGAAAQMFSLDILWGGSMALRACVVRDPELRKHWAHCFVEDTSVVGFLQKRHLKLQILPRLTMINPESISLAGCYRFLRRQMVCMRLHHPAWQQVLRLTLLMAISPCLALIVALLGFVLGQDTFAWTMLGILLAFILAAGLPLVYIDGYFYYTAPKEKPLSTLHPKHIPVIPMTILLQLAAVLAACRIFEIDWRGIRYAIGADGSVRRLNDCPYTETPTVDRRSIV